MRWEILFGVCHVVPDPKCGVRHLQNHGYNVRMSGNAMWQRECERRKAIIFRRSQERRERARKQRRCGAKELLHSKRRASTLAASVVPSLAKLTLDSPRVLSSSQPNRTHSTQRPYIVPILLNEVGIRGATPPALTSSRVWHGEVT